MHIRRLLCKNITGFGCNVNGVLEDTDDCGNVNTAAIQEVVLDIQPGEFSEGEHSYKGGKQLCVVKDEYVSEEVMQVKNHIKGTLRYFMTLNA